MNDKHGEARSDAGQAFKLLRKAAGFATQQALAEDIGYSRTWVNQWESGAQPPVWVPKYLRAVRTIRHMS
jgi:transcriptional regulator with XRE-family HTH domain